MGRGRPKGSGGINKSEKIREYLVSNPDASTNMIVEALGSFGVSAALVGGVRSRMNGEVGSKKKSVAAAVNSEDMASLHSIVKTFADADVVLDLISDIIKLDAGPEKLGKMVEKYKSEFIGGDTVVETDVAVADDEDEDEDEDEDDDE